MTSLVTPKLFDSSDPPPLEVVVPLGRCRAGTRKSFGNCDTPVTLNNRGDRCSYRVKVED
jgi:hypothetical protein